MKKLLALLLALTLVVGLGAAAFGATSKTKDITDSALYKDYHNGHMTGLNQSGLSEREWQAQAENYRAERKKSLEEALAKDVKDGYMTQEEADQYLADFGTMADYCGGHMGYSSYSDRGYHRGTGAGMGLGRGHGRCHR